MATGKYQRWLEPQGLELLKGWARDGLTDEQIAHNMGITRKTLYVWKSRYGAICNALKEGKELVDIQVENALLKRALGYDFQETKVEKSDKDGTKIVQTLKHVPGDTTAQIFWLKNRRPDKWRDRRDAALYTAQEQQDAVSDFLAAVKPKRAELEALYAAEE